MDNLRMDMVSNDLVNSLLHHVPLSPPSGDSVGKKNPVEDNAPPLPIKSMSEKNAKELTQAINSILQENNVSVHFQLFKNPTTLILKLVQNDTGETIVEFPQEKILKIFQYMLQSLGFFKTQKA